MAREFPNEQNVFITKVDCSVHTDLAASFNISAYPTIYYFRGDRTHRKYDGPKVASDIITFIKQLQSPSSIRINQNAEGHPDVENVRALLQSFQYVLLLSVDSSRMQLGREVMSAFNDFAMSRQELIGVSNFGHLAHSISSSEMAIVTKWYIVGNELVTNEVEY